MKLGRRTLMGWAGTSVAASVLASPSLAQNARADTLNFVPSTSLVSLDPVFSTALVAVQHG
ncbi:MAG: ABC transporter substrate-binding protein, partial [Alphaproteobacteria bacterium]